MEAPLEAIISNNTMVIIINIRVDPSPITMSMKCTTTIQPLICRRPLRQPPRPIVIIRQTVITLNCLQDNLIRQCIHCHEVVLAIDQFLSSLNKFEQI